MKKMQSVKNSKWGRALMKNERCWGDPVIWMYFHRRVRIAFLLENFKV